MTKRPTKIKVACFDIGIEDYILHQSAILGRFGEYSCSESLIRICPNISKIKCVDTLLHEINHVIYWAYGMDDQDKEERIVGTYATAWTQVFRDNPDLLDFIKHNLKEQADD